MRSVYILGGFLATLLLFRAVHIYRSPQSDPSNMLGGFSKSDPAANDEGLEQARQALSTKLATDLDGPVKVQVLDAESQVVAGTNYKMTVKVDDAHGDTKYYKAQIWAKLPAHGGGHDITKLDLISAEEAGQDGKEGVADPEVDAAAGYAVQELSSRSNSLVPFYLKRVISATKTHGAGLETKEGGGAGSPREGVTHHLKLVVSQGGQGRPEGGEATYEVDVGEASHGFVMRSIRGPL